MLSYVLHLKKFSRVHAPIFSKFKCSICKHIEEGICNVIIVTFLVKLILTLC